MKRAKLAKTPITNFFSRKPQTAVADEVAIEVDEQTHFDDPPTSSSAVEPSTSSGGGNLMFESTAEVAVETHPPSAESVSSDEEEPVAVVDCEALTQPCLLPNSLKLKPLRDTDISLVVNSTNLTDVEKQKFLVDFYKPEKQFKFPYVVQAKKKRYAQHSWLDKNPRLAYSHVEQGFYCASCVIFASDRVGRGSMQSTGTFVKKPFRKFKDFDAPWKNHVSADYHQFSEIKAAEFLHMLTSKETVAQKVDANYKKNVIQNREMLSSIIKTIVFLGKHDLPLRGNIDSGEFQLIDPPHNDGVFRAILRFMGRSGDPGVQHIVQAPKNANYLSPQSQNELLSIIASTILKNVVKKINCSGMFSLMADETSSSNREFISTVIRYVDDETSTVDEVFLGFQQLDDGVTGEQVADAILACLTKNGIDVNKAVGQGYDGASNMSGHIKGVQARIREIVPTAEYFHCASHRFNLAATDAAASIPIAQVLSCVREIINFFGQSPKRGALLAKMINELVPSSNRSKVKNLCATRWVERHESLLAFRELFLPIISALQSLTVTERDATPGSLLLSISTFSSIITLIVVSEVATELKQISLYLQQKELDLIQAYEQITLVRKALEQRLEDDTDFQTLYNECLRIANKVGVKEELPRRVNRRLPHIDDTTDQRRSTMDYYFNHVYVTYIKHLISELDRRFSDTQRVAFSIQLLLQKFLFSTMETDTLDRKPFEDILILYRQFIDCDSFQVFDAELRRWKLRWFAVHKNERPQTLKETLQTFDAVQKQFYPTIYQLLKLLMTLPVSTASTERTFSCLARIFTDKRTAMETVRLSDLAILSFYFKEASDVDIDLIIDTFAGTDNADARRLKFK